MLSNVPPRLKTLVEDMRLRIVRSAFKLTKAVATANASRVATRDHADYALRFVQDKINFIRSIKLEDIQEAKPDMGDRRNDARSSRRISPGNNSRSMTSHEYCRNRWRGNATRGRFSAI